MRPWILPLLIFPFLLMGPFATAKTIILIPGAASSAGRIALVGVEGVLGAWDHWAYFDRFEREFRKQGHRVEVCPRIPDGDQGGLEERARDCAAFLRTLPRDSRVLLIGHSLGGLVGRRLLVDPAIAARVEALLTISTPHRGTPLADLLDSRSEDTAVLRAAARAVGFESGRPRYVPELRWGLKQELPNPLRVPVFSIANHAKRFAKMPAFEWTGHWLSRTLTSLHPAETRHDGIVPLASMSKGLVLGVIEADHMESACILQGQWSSGCEQVLRLIKPLLNRNEGAGPVPQSGCVPLPPRQSCGKFPR